MPIVYGRRRMPRCALTPGGGAAIVLGTSTCGASTMVAWPAQSRMLRVKHLWAVTVLDGSGRSTLGVPSNTDVMGSLTAIDVRRVLRQIEALR